MRIKSIYGFIYIFSLIMASVMASCSHDDVRPVPPPPAEVGRTVLVYMLGAENGLGASAPYDYDMKDIAEMCEAAVQGDIVDGRLIVFHSASNGNQVLKEITADGLVDTLKIYSNALVPQSGERMAEVMADMKTLSPARDYGLVLWGHGSGWLEDGIDDDYTPDAVAYSYGHEHHDRYKMNMSTLARVLDGRGFSFVYFDCCYMASVEAMYQLRDVTPLIVASSAEVLALGMPYNLNVRCFFESTPDVLAAASNTFDFYNSQADLRNRTCTMSVISTAGIERLALATAAVYRTAAAGMPTGFRPQPFTLSSPYYYYDFASYIHALTDDSGLLDEFDDALADVVIYAAATDKLWNTLSIREHSGLTTFIIQQASDISRKGYNTLEWFADVASELDFSTL